MKSNHSMQWALPMDRYPPYSSPSSKPQPPQQQLVSSSCKIKQNTILLPVFNYNVTLPKLKTMKKSKQEIADERGKFCAGLITTIKEYKDNGIAEGKLFSFCKGKLMRVAMGLLKDAQKAKDVVSDGWMDMMGEIWNGNYHEQNTFDGFGGRIIRNICLKIIKEAKRFVGLDAISDLTNPEEEQSRFSDEMKIVLKGLMSKLSVIMQDKITMFYIDDIPWKIVGKKYNVSADTVRGEVSKKMIFLREKLKG